MGLQRGERRMKSLRDVLGSKRFYGPEGRRITAGYLSNLGKLKGGKTVKWEMTGMQLALARMRRLNEIGKDLVPIWADILTEFKANMRANFKARLSPDTPPERWAKLSKSYASYKADKGARRIADLQYSGRLKWAVYGGPGWFESIKPTVLHFGIRGIPYAAIHENGGKINVPAQTPTQKQRSYFWAQFKNTGDSMWKAMALKDKIKAHTVTMPQRNYFLTKQGKLPMAVVNYMVARIEDEFTGVA